MSTVLAGSRGEPIGVLTFERHDTGPFTDQTLKLVEAFASLFGPQLGLQLQANRLVAGRVTDRVGDGFQALFGARRPFSIRAVGVIALALTVIFAEGEHRVTAKSTAALIFSTPSMSALRRQGPAPRQTAVRLQLPPRES